MDFLNIPVFHTKYMNYRIIGYRFWLAQKMYIIINIYERAAAEKKAPGEPDAFAFRMDQNFRGLNLTPGPMVVETTMLLM